MIGGNPMFRRDIAKQEIRSFVSSTHRAAALLEGRAQSSTNLND
jgi:hypothetical protein